MQIEALLKINKCSEESQAARAYCTDDGLTTYGQSNEEVASRLKKNSLDR